MFVFSSEVALEMYLRLEIRVGPTAEIGEAVNLFFFVFPDQGWDGKSYHPKVLERYQKIKGKPYIYGR